MVERTVKTPDLDLENETAWEAAWGAFDIIFDTVRVDDASATLKGNQRKTRRIVTWNNGQAGMKITHHRKSDIQVWLNVFGQWDTLEEFEYGKEKGFEPSQDVEVRVWQAYALARKFSLKPIVNK